MKSNGSRQMGDRNRRITSERNLRLADLRIVGSNDEIAHHCQLCAASESVSVNRRDRDAVRSSNAKNHAVESLKRRFDLVRGMIGYIDAGRKRALTRCRYN